MISRGASWSVLIAVWATIGGLLTLELYLSLAAADPAVPVAWVALGQFMRVFLWAILTPVVFWLQRTFPIDRESWRWAIPLHLVLSVVAMLLIYLTRLFVAFLYLGQDPGQYWDRAFAEFYGRNLIDLPIYWTVYGVGYTLGVVWRYREARIRSALLERNLAQSEIKALKAQLHPHFLFNTLNTISVLVRDGQNPQAVSLIAQLSSLLRLALETTGQQEVTLRQELDFLRRYLDIQKVRFEDRLDVRLEVEAVAQEALVPNLILQPIVENAVIHGVSRTEARGTVTVRAWLQFNRLHLEVCDDGPGFAMAGGPKREGIGLSNTRARLDRMFGDAGRFICSNRPEGGAVVEIVIPFRRKESVDSHEGEIES